MCKTMYSIVFMCMYLFWLQHSKKGKMERKKKKTIIDFLNNLLGLLSILNNKSNVKMGSGLQKCEN